MDELATAQTPRRSYRARMYHGRARIVKRGRVHLTRDEFVFLSADAGRFAVPLSDLRAQSMAYVPLRLTEGRRRHPRSPLAYLAWWVMGMAFFHRERPHWFFHTRDLRILRDPGWDVCPEACARVQENRPRWIAFRRVTFWVMLLFLCLWTFQPGFRQALSGPITSVIPIRADAWLGEQAFENLQMTQRLRLVQDQEFLVPLEHVLARIQQAEPERERLFACEVYLAESTEVNAFALPGGKLVVLVGLLRQAESEDELAAVLAHEIAHTQKRHHLRQMIEQGVCYTLWSLIFHEQDYLSDWMASQLTTVSALRFSRDQEREADGAAIQRVSDAGYDPEAMATMFERWAGSRGSTPEWQVLLSTHPDCMERAQDVRTWIGEQPNRPHLSWEDRQNWAGYRERIEGLVRRLPALSAQRSP